MSNDQNEISFPYRQISELLNSNPSLVCIFDLEGKLSFANCTWSKKFGLMQQDLMGNIFVDLVHSEDSAKVQGVLKDLFLAKDGASGEFECRILEKNRKSKLIAWSLSSNGKTVLAIGRDLADSKDIEDFYLEIQSQAKIGGWILDTADLTTRWTEETYKIHGIPAGTPTDLGKGIDFYHPDYRDAIRVCVKNCIENKTPYEDDFKFISANGKELWVRATGSPVLDRDGNVIKLIGTFQDINEYKLLTEQLEETAAQLSDVLIDSPGMVYQFRMLPDGHMYFPYSSPQVFAIYGITAEDFKRDPSLMLSMAHPEDMDSLQQKIVESASTLLQFEWGGRIIAASGETKWIVAKSHPHLLEDKSILWNGIVIDVTKEKQLEENILFQRQISEHSARLASIGELAAGVGHEINNPLAIVMGLLAKAHRLITTDIQSKQDLLDIFDKQQDACLRIKKIVGGLRTFAYAGGLDESDVADLGRAVKDAGQFLTEIYRQEGVLVALQLPSDQCFVSCTNTHIQQIFMNLMTNARDACKGKEDAAILVTVSDGLDTWTLNVKDNGSGIAPENQGKIFDTFFTTKSVGEGTGLGLSLTKKIIEASGGSIEFNSDSHGTTFSVCLLKEAPPELNVDKKEQEQPATEQKIRAIVIDDEEVIREYLVDSLEQMNCVVFSYGSALTALAEMENKEFDLIITDIQMPGMDGLNFLQEVFTSNLSPQAVRVVISGGINRDLSTASRDYRFGLIDAYIQKPFSAKDLADVVAKAGQKAKKA